MRMLAILLSFCLLAASPHAVISVNLHSSNTGMSNMNWSVSGNQITIWEDWDYTGLGTVQFNGLPLFKDYTITKVVTNNTGVDWTSFGAELLDPHGNINDWLYDQPRADWVPNGYGHSNDLDGLSFSQGSGTVKTSNAFSSVYTDPAFQRDYYDLSDGLISGDGGTDQLTFSIRNNGFFNDGFLLAQRPNVETSQPIPEPTTMVLFGLGLAGAGLYRRMKN